MLQQLPTPLKSRPMSNVFHKDPATVEDTRSKKVPTFLDLPVDIRWMIYSLLFPNPLVTNASGIESFFAFRSSCKKSVPPTAFLYTCKAIYLECRALACRSQALPIDGIDLEHLDLLKLKHERRRFSNELQDEAKIVYVTCFSAFQIFSWNPTEPVQSISHGSAYYNQRLLTRVVLDATSGHCSLDWGAMVVSDLIAYCSQLRIIILIDDTENIKRWGMRTRQQAWRQRLTQALEEKELRNTDHKTVIAHETWKDGFGCLCGKSYMRTFSHLHIFMTETGLEDTWEKAAFSWREKCSHEHPEERFVIPTASERVLNEIIRQWKKPILPWTKKAAEREKMLKIQYL